MKKIFIHEKLEELNNPVSSLSLGEFDYIGEFTAKKNRDFNSDLFKTAGCFFRPNYERGMLLHSLIKNHKIESVLEIGFGRGYGTLCISKAMNDMGISGKIVTVDVNFDQNQINLIKRIFPETWFNRVEFFQGTSDEFFAKSQEKFDLIYIDGDHREEVVLRDWQNSSTRYNKFVLFDDYHLPTKNEKDIEVAKVVDKIELEKELILMDRRIFHDDREISDEDLDYGQVLIRNPEYISEYNMDW